MSTNYYLFTSDKSIINKYKLSCVDEMYTHNKTVLKGYEVHIAKTAGGWVPLFQSHTHINTKQDMLQLLQEPDILLFNEYGKEIQIKEFIEQVVEYKKTDKDESHIHPGHGTFMSEDGLEFQVYDFV